MKSKITIIIAILLLGVGIWAAGYYMGRSKCEKETVIERDTVTVEKVLWDTAFVEKPVLINSRLLEDSIHVLIAMNELKEGMIDSLLGEIYGDGPMDTIDIVIPREQKEYKDSTYHAWVSGFQPQLDSIQVYNRIEYRTITITEKEKVKPSPWGLGVQVGMGLGVHESQVFTTPYIGVGVTYTFLRF